VQKASLPLNEQERLEALQRYEILDTEGEEAFDELTSLAASICGTPIAMMSLIDTHRQWFKSKVGVEATETSRDIAFCAHGILGKEMFVIPDASKDSRFVDNPLVTQDPHIRFYAGVPLVTAEGQTLGMLCVNDRIPRDLTVSQKNALRTLGRQVMNLLDMRRTMTALARAQKDLKQREEQLHLLLNSTEEGVYGIDLEGTCTWANRACAKLLHYAGVEELIGKKMHETIHHIEECPIEQWLGPAKGTHVDSDVLWRSDGTCFPAEYWAHPILRDGKTVGAVVSFIDITERKRLELGMRQSEKMSAVGQLAGGVAHEINNPLGVILGFTQGMLRRASPGDLYEMPLKAVEREAIRCKNLVQDLLTFSRTSKADREPMDLNQAIEGASSLIMAQARLGQIEVKKDLAPHMPHILGNPNQIQQVIINLGNNALDAMGKQGTLRLRTECLSEGSRSWVCLYVTDTGSGIPPTILPRIFEPFFTTKPLGQGTGLGLGLVHEIVQKHSGTVDVKSQPGCTEFCIKFPVHRQSALPENRSFDH
jgi:PAS domain S-box-containing protein